MNTEMEDSGRVFGELLELLERYNPFQEIDGLEGCSLTGLGSSLSRQNALAVPSSQQLALWRQVRRGRRIETIRTDIVERLCSFLDPETPVEVQILLKQSQASGVFRSQQRDKDL